VSRDQLLSLGWSSDSVFHRIERGRLHPLWAGVYAVGRPEVTQHGRWMAAVLACGSGAALSHQSAAQLWAVTTVALTLTDIATRISRGRSRNGYEVDFLWPDLGLVVETDGLRYHRTPAQQTRDRERDQAHTATGLTPLRFTHEQVARHPDRVEATLRRVAARLVGASRGQDDP
jgi:very-short-patch-repair endonuclease